MVLVLWLGKHKEIHIPDYEITKLQNKPTVSLIEALYKGNHTSDPAIRVRGYKSPNDIMDARPLRILGEYFNRTKLVVGLRHPVWMIESFYNHRIQNGLKMPPLEKVPYNNQGFSQGVTLGRAAYHANLLHLGKTNLSADELKLLPRPTLRNLRKSNYTNFPTTPNKVYLYDTAQLSDTNETRKTQLLQDVSNFLGLNSPLKNLMKVSPGKTAKSQIHQEMLDSQKIHICEDRYEQVRKKLIDIGTAVSDWIMTYLVNHPDLYISNRDHFYNILESYKHDPCGPSLSLNSSSIISSNTAIVTTNSTINNITTTN